MLRIAHGNLGYRIPRDLRAPLPVQSSMRREELYTLLWRRLISFPRSSLEQLAGITAEDSNDPGRILYQVEDPEGNSPFGNYRTGLTHNSTIYKTSVSGSPDEMGVVDVLCATKSITLNCKGKQHHNIFLRTSWSKDLTVSDQVCNVVSTMDGIFSNPEEVRAFLSKLDRVAPLNRYSETDTVNRRLWEWRSSDVGEREKIRWLFTNFVQLIVGLGSDHATRDWGLAISLFWSYSIINHFFEV